MSTEAKDFPIVPQRTREKLNNRQLTDYKTHRTSLVKWMLKLGRDPDRAIGYQPTTVRARCYHTDAFYNWVWDEDDQYTTHVTHEHANEYTRQLAFTDHSATHKTNLVKSVKMLFRWREWQFGEKGDWNPPITYARTETQTTPRDYLTRKERQRLRDVSLEYGSVPHYNAVTPDERTKWKQHLARRLGKPMHEIGPEEFNEANSHKITSLIWTALDTGLRPIEVERASVSWIDPENALLRIPAEDSAKNTEHWHVSIREQTAQFLENWLQERALIEKYDDTDTLWLTRHGNPYQSTSLKFVLHKLCEMADIPIENRQMTWYSIRHSVGTYMTREEGLAAAKSQLRHKSVNTTMKYDQTPVEDRRKALNRMG